MTPAKLLLFGEYTILFGGRALATPIHEYHGQWTRGAVDQRMVNFLDFLELQEPQFPLDFNRLRSDILGGLNFESNIPDGYGLGSSGCLCAAILKRYGQVNNDDYGVLQTVLSGMESFFHGKSSGLDPVVSFSEKTIMVSQDGRFIPHLKPFEWPQEEGVFFLVDSGRPRNTQHYVKIFREKLSSSKTFEEAVNQILPTVDECIGHTLDQAWGRLFHSFSTLSQWQLRNMPEMWTDEVRALAQIGLDSRNYAIKICGAGGGGFFLGYGHANTIMHQSNVQLIAQP